MTQKLILASGSPRRFQILRNIGFEPDEVVISNIDETPNKQEKPEKYCKRIAKEKALKVWEDNKKSFVIAGDTVAAVGTRILGKATDAEEAKKFLKLMSGKKHRVYSSVCLITPEGNIKERSTLTYVKFKRLTDQEIDEYVASKHWKDKAGAYGLQEDPGAFVVSINGSFSGVIGMPAYEAKCLLTGVGFTTS